jgi:hypothetical protein
VRVIKTNDELEVQFYSVLILSLDGAEWPASRCGRFNPWERDPLPTEQKVVWVSQPLY